MHDTMNQSMDWLPEPSNQYPASWLTDLKGMHCINLLRQQVFLQFSASVKETQALRSSTSQEIFFMLMEYRQFLSFTQFLSLTLYGSN